MLRVKRVYEKATVKDGTRFLVQRLWPRGIKKQDLKMQAWLRDVAPSDGLRRWFAHDPLKWMEFQRRYRAELTRNATALRPILEAAKHGDVTLLYSAHDTEHNNALVLKEYVEQRIKGR